MKRRRFDPDRTALGVWFVALLAAITWLLLTALPPGFPVGLAFLLGIAVWVIVPLMLYGLWTED